MHGQQNVKNEFLWQMANIIHEKFLIWVEDSKHHSANRCEKITTPFLST
jgi:hypothetical protein